MKGENVGFCRDDNIFHAARTTQGEVRVEKAKRNGINPRTLCKVRGNRPVQRCAFRRSVFMNEFMSLSNCVAHDRPKSVRNTETTFLFQFKDCMKSTRRKRFTLSLYSKLLLVGRALIFYGTEHHHLHIMFTVLNECEMSGSLKTYFYMRRLSEV